jgi:hypothetical protein
MSEETRKLWDLVKCKLSKDGLLDVLRYYPELQKEIDVMIDSIEHLQDSE